MILAPLQGLGAQEQQLIVKLFQHDPSDRLTSVGGVIILLPGPQGDGIEPGCKPEGNGWVGLNEEARPGSRIRIGAQGRENCIRFLDLAHLGEAHRLAVTLAVAKKNCCHDSDGKREHDRRDAHGFPAKKLHHWVVAADLAASVSATIPRPSSGRKPGRQCRCRR